MKLRACLASFLVFSQILHAADHDIVIYGGTCSAIIAAVQAKKMGKSVIIVSPDKHLGGLSSGGLGFTDTGNKAVIGGLSRDFYHRIYLHYDKDASWVQQKKSEYGGKGRGRRRWMVRTARCGSLSHTQLSRCLKIMSKSSVSRSCAMNGSTARKA